MENKKYVEDWTKISDSTAKFIFQECEKNLKETIKTAELHTNRAILILKFSIPIIIILVAFISTAPPLIQIQTQLALVGILFTSIVIAKSIEVFNLYDVRPTGNTGHNLLKSEYVEHPKQNLLYLYNAVRTCDISIENNKENNGRRLDKLESLIKTIRFGLIFASTYAVISVLSVSFRPFFQNLVEVVTASLSAVVAVGVAVAVEYFRR